MNLCACMGPMYGEPFCYCQMKEMKLPLNKVARDEDKEKLKEVLEEIFGKYHDQ